MTSLARKIAPWVIGAVIVIQLYRPARTNPPVDVTQDLSVTAKADPAVLAIVDRSCNDCHSNRTVWPWYSGVAPVSWLVTSDVSDARRHVNFSEWGKYPAYQQQSHLDEICKIVTQRDMPPFTYLLAHRDAALSEADRQAICQWTKLAAEVTASLRPPDFELRGDLAKIFSVSNCEYISGMTCRITYNGALPLPSEVFFEEFDESGKQAGARVRLIYPHLDPGERGAATFRTRGKPSKIALEGEWNAPWRDPY